MALIRNVGQNFVGSLTKKFTSVVSTGAAKPRLKLLSSNPVVGHNVRQYTLLSSTILREPTSTSKASAVYEFNVKRYYAKKKDKGGKKGGKKITLSGAELEEVIDYPKMVQQMDEVVEHLKQEYIHQLSIRANMGSFEVLMVETEDGKFPLKQIAQIAQKSPTLLAINCGAMSKYLPDVKAALDKSGMNVNPQTDKNTIFVPLPKVTREHRENLAKSAKTLCDRSKTKLKDVHNRYQREAKKKTGVSEDLTRGVIETIHDKLHEYQSSCEDLMKRKQDELLHK